MNCTNWSFIVPIVLLKLRGEKGHWSTRGIIYSLLGGALGNLTDRI